jgi:O-antigen/teichoic acid export membrane protein
MPSLIGLVLAHVLSSVCYVAIAAPLSLRCLWPTLRFDPKTARGLLRIAAPISVGSLFVMINTRADVVMLAYLDSDTAVGLYTAAFRFFDVAALSAAILGGPLVPMFSDRARQGASAVLEPYRRIHEGLGTILIPLAVLTPVLSEYALTLTFGEEFRDSAPVLNVLAWVAALTFYAQVGSAANLALHEVGHGYWNAALAASLNIGLNSFLIPRYGILGAAWSTLACEISLVTVSQSYLRKNIGNVFRLRHWSGIAAASGAMAFVVYGVLPTAHPIWRVLAGGAAYLALSVQLGLIDRAELERLRSLWRGRSVGPSQR